MEIISLMISFMHDINGMRSDVYIIDSNWIEGRTKLSITIEVLNTNTMLFFLHTNSLVFYAKCYLIEPNKLDKCSWLR